MVCLAAALVGVDFGWKPLPTGGMEYIIQVEPGTLEALRPDNPDDAIGSDVPAELRDVRHFRIVVGNKPLPKIPPPAAAAGPPAEGASSRTTAAAPPGHPPLLSRPWGATPMAPSLPPIKGAAFGVTNGTLSPDAAATKPSTAPPAGSAGPAADAGKGESKSGDVPPVTDTSEPVAPASPWLPLWAWGATLLCCASVGGNLYLGWIAWGIRSQCRALLQAAGSQAGEA
jgi:hypothetical protein